MQKAMSQLSVVCAMLINNRIMKRFVNNIVQSTSAIIVCLLLLLSSCVDDMFIPTDNDVPEGYVRLQFTTHVSDMKRVDTRSVDPDGVDVQSLTLFVSIPTDFLLLPSMRKSLMTDRLRVDFKQIFRKKHT